MLTINTLTLAQTKKAMNAEFFWLQALANASHNGDLELALSSLKQAIFNDNSRYCPESGERVLDRDISLDAPQLSFYTKLLVRDQIQKDLFSRGVLDSGRPNTINYWLDTVRFDKVQNPDGLSSIWELTILRKTPKTLEELRILTEVLEANAPTDEQQHLYFATHIRTTNHRKV